MKLLFCCENYWPSRGGVQEVMRQIAEHLAAAGHDVTVATAFHPARNEDSLNGVAIRQFRISGSLAVGIEGDAEAYRRFVVGFDGDAILIKAAQQWSFDALWPVLDQIRPRKVFIPCGFSGLYEPAFADYFAEMPRILRKFDHLIFYAESYRDIDFARTIGLTAFSVVPNGASEVEFDRVPDGQLRAKLGIPEDDFVFLTVGSPIQGKGHLEVAEAFRQMDTGGRNATLILNGEFPKFDYWSLLKPRRLAGLVRVFWRSGWSGVRAVVSPNPRQGLMETAAGSKRVLCLNLPRHDVVSAFLESDLFVFASKVEYSPLVLFEAAAAGLPFLTVPTGNAAEIVCWTGGGWLCPAEVDEKNYVRVSPPILAREMEKAMHSPELMKQLGTAGKAAWRERFTWAAIAGAYERVLRGESVLVSLMPGAAAGDRGGCKMCYDTHSDRFA